MHFNPEGYVKDTDTDILREKMAHIQWFHRIDLGHGLITPGVDDSLRKLCAIRMPEDLSGKTVLDIGAWDGFFSFEAERRGASRVMATDDYCWSGKSWGSKKGFDFARETLNSQVEDKLIDVMDISTDTVGSFDIVLFLGVLYHLRHPFIALEKTAAVTRECLILETEVDLINLRHPAMIFYPGTELNDDPTNWWAPNPRGLLAMLKSLGFTRIDLVTPPKSFIKRFARATKQYLTQRKNPFTECHRDRVVVHAWK